MHAPILSVISIETRLNVVKNGHSINTILQAIFILPEKAIIFIFLVHSSQYIVANEQKLLKSEVIFLEQDFLK